MLNLDKVIKEYDDYVQKSIKFKEYQKQLNDFRCDYPLNKVILFDRNKIYT